jgi:hypothetical protein
MSIDCAKGCPDDRRAAAAIRSVARLTLMLASLSFAAVCTAADDYAPASAKDRASLQADVSLNDDDNVDRGPGSGVDFADQFLDAGVRRIDTLFQGVDTAFALISSGRGDAYARYNHLDSLSAALEGRLSYRASGDFAEPTYSIFLRGTADYVRSDIRRNLEFEVGAAVNAPLTDRLSWDLNLSDRRVDARSVVFTGNSVALQGDLNFDATDKTFLYASGGYRVGDATLDGSQTFENPLIAIQFHDVADDAFPEDPYSAAPLHAYRLRAQTALIQLGVNRTLQVFGLGSSVDLSVRQVVVNALNGTPFFSSIADRYVVRQITLGFATKF